MLRGPNLDIAFPSKDPGFEFLGYLLIEARNPRHASSYYDHVRVEKIDYVGRRPGESIDVVVKDCLGEGVSFAQLLCHGGSVFRVSSAKAIVEGKTRPRKVKFDAPGLSAVARAGLGEILFMGCGPGQGVMSPLSGDAVLACVRPATPRDPSPASGSDNDRKDQVGSGSRSIAGLGDGKAVRVIGDPDLSLESLLKVRLKILTIQPGRIGVFDPSSAGRDGSGYPDSDTSASLGFGFGAFDQSCDGLHGSWIVPLGSGDSLSEQFFSLGPQGDDFDLGTPNVESDLHPLAPSLPLPKNP